jgi:hypothetical protein
MATILRQMLIIEILIIEILIIEILIIIAETTRAMTVTAILTNELTTIPINRDINIKLRINYRVYALVCMLVTYCCHLKICNIYKLHIFMYICVYSGIITHYYVGNGGIKTASLSLFDGSGVNASLISPSDATSYFTINGLLLSIINSI